jgi:hypothetical protein
MLFSSKLERSAKLYRYSSHESFRLDTKRMAVRPYQVETLCLTAHRTGSLFAALAWLNTLADNRQAFRHTLPSRGFYPGNLHSKRSSPSDSSHMSRSFMYVS